MLSETWTLGQRRGGKVFQSAHRSLICDGKHLEIEPTCLSTRSE